MTPRACAPRAYPSDRSLRLRRTRARFPARQSPESGPPPPSQPALVHTARIVRRTAFPESFAECRSESPRGSVVTLLYLESLSCHPERSEGSTRSDFFLERRPIAPRGFLASQTPLGMTKTSVPNFVYRYTS